MQIISSTFQINPLSEPVLKYCQWIEELGKINALADLEAAIHVHNLIEGEILTPVEKSTPIKFRTYRIIIPYQERQQELERYWLLANKIVILDILQQEGKELERSAVVAEKETEGTRRSTEEDGVQ